MTNPLLSISNVEMHLGATKAIDGVSLVIRENEFFALLGASGAAPAIFMWGARNSEGEALAIIFKFTA